MREAIGYLQRGGEDCWGGVVREEKAVAWYVYS